MFGFLRSMFVPKPPAVAEATYIALVAQARNPFFYESYGVPDTLDGRFELIVLHLFLLQQRLATENTEFSRVLSEMFFLDMDRSLREMSIADTGVAKRIKKMGMAYHGRLQAYAAGLTDPELLRSALARNLYGTVAEGDVAQLDQMADYILRMTADINAAPITQITSGHYAWPAIS